MRVLAAPTVDDPRPDAFNFCLPGELIHRGIVCDGGRRGGCGCERMWTGNSSGKGTTAAQVVEREDLDFDTYTDLMATAIATYGCTRDTAEAEAVNLAEIADDCEPGALISIRLSTDQQEEVFEEIHP